jgi:GAF domain-containing protein
MPRYEVSCPAAPSSLPEGAAVRLDAEHWLGAYKAALARVGVAAVPHVLCDVQADGSIHVTDPAGGAVWRIRELGAEAPAVPPVPAPAAASGGGATAPARPGPTRTADELLAELFERAGEAAGLARDAALAFLLDLALEEVDAEAGSILLSRGAAGRELEFAVVRGPRAKELLALRTVVPVGVGIVGFCVRENVCLAVSDAERDPRFHRAISEALGYPTRSLLCAPIARKGQVLGAIEVLNRRGGLPFGQAELAALAYLAHRAAEHVARA